MARRRGSLRRAARLFAPPGTARAETVPTGATGLGGYDYYLPTTPPRYGQLAPADVYNQPVEIPPYPRGAFYVPPAQAYDYYLPVTGPRMATGAPGAEGGQATRVEALGGYPAQVAYGAGNWYIPETLGGAGAGTTQAGGTTEGTGEGVSRYAATGGAAATRARANSAPPGINQGWWDQFTAEHGGADPDEYYGRTGEGLAEALADQEWGDRFARDAGRPPNDDEWRAHWFQTRTGATQEDRDRWRMERTARRAWKRATGRKLVHGGDAEQFEQRPPTFVPPYTIWR